MMKKQLLLALLLVSACAKSSDEIPVAYVSPLLYKGHDCDQLGQEMERVSRRVATLTGSINKNAQGDSVAMGVGLVLFWPALFFIDGDSPEAQEYGRLKGEFEALEKAAIQKNCAIEIAPPPVQEAEKGSESKETLKGSDFQRRKN